MAPDPSPSPTPPEPTPPDATATGDDARPPWERNGEPFDPARAWTLIQRLRTDLATAKAPPAPTASPDTVTGSPPQPVPPAGSTPDTDEAERLRADLIRERVGRRFGLDDALTELLGTGDEEAITARGQLLAELRAGHPGTAASGVSRRPVERLQGGGNPTAPVEETDPAKLAAKVRRGF